MSVLTFKIHDVKKLIEELDAASNFSPSVDDLFNPEMYSDGIVRDKNGRTELEAEKHSGMFWPSENFIDQSKVKPALILVGDHGVYLITNAKADGSPSSRGTVAYAKGCNPGLDDDFYENKCNLFGGGDCSVRIPSDWAKWAIQNQKAFRIKLTTNSVELMQG
ncbi:DUF3085 domain-containing protein [Plesiomonas shigelloides subsp. oncorhynchi]|uniref:DUF3085 domain-containing protein n=1 Tax=Gammaproteobacteria TaxID=1236 RepID=UPI0010784120|nr:MULTISPECIES: DUF3085 domain-containing protein [Gammaproteobacteria]EAB9607508.1 DUF3085 domain-containing protein [Salmonella enterica subsp. enterica serovar Infantis]ECU8224409.1 DUF3085 domain-containing protein [Salmonella enterica subsp. enterica serovar Thompson]MDA1379348.1 DUF3085 domain-containing protein [Plesiomonas shigelloides]EFB1672124.1 DUF3085 domain-containing protein [Escherichia coli]EFF6323047.1 DUF3085 domain-containing protein [Escherichia coli]